VGVALSLLRILRFSPLACLLVLPLAGCSGHSAVTTGTRPSTPSVGFTATPQVEGTGPEAPQSPGNGGISVSLAGLPVGDGSVVAVNNNGNDECISVLWPGHMPSGVLLTITNAVITQGPFTVVDVTTAGCSAADESLPACAGFQLSTADNDNGSACYAGIAWTGNGPQPDQGHLTLAGVLSCPGTDLATCQTIGHQVQNSAAPPLGTSIRFYFCGPGCDDYPSPPGNTNPTQSTSPTQPTSPSSAGTSPASTGPTSPSTSSP
jgi:hypothetical protein